MGDILASNMAAVSHFSISSPAGRAFAHPAGISCSVRRNLQKEEEEEEKPLMERENWCHSRSRLSRVCRQACTPANGSAAHTSRCWFHPPVCTHPCVLTHTHKPWMETQYGKHAFLFKYQRQLKQTGRTLRLETLRTLSNA